MKLSTDNAVTLLALCVFGLSLTTVYLNYRYEQLKTEVATKTELPLGAARNACTEVIVCDRVADAFDLWMSHEHRKSNIDKRRPY